MSFTVERRNTVPEAVLRHAPFHGADAPRRQSDALSVTSTVVDDGENEVGSPRDALRGPSGDRQSFQITTAFQETNPVLRNAVYQGYLAYNPQECECTDNLAWSKPCDHVKAALSASRDRSAWRNRLARLGQRMRSPTA